MSKCYATLHRRHGFSSGIWAGVRRLAAPQSTQNEMLETSGTEVQGWNAVFPIAESRAKDAFGCFSKSNCSAGLKSKNRPGGHRTLTRRKMQQPVLLKASIQSCGGRNCDVRKILSLRLHADLTDMLIWEPSAGKYFLATQHMVCGSLCGLCRVHQFICKYEAATKRLGFLKCFIACFATADCSVTMFAEQMNQKHNAAFQAFRSYHGSSACVGVCWHYPQHPHKSRHEYKLPAQQSEQSGLSSQKRSCARGTLHANACGRVRV